MAIDKASVFRAALLQLDVDPEAVTAFDSAETEDEVHAAGAKLVEAAVERGRALVSHGEAQAKVDHALQIKHLRKILGGADDENIVQLAGRVMTDLRNARAATPAAPPTSSPVDKSEENALITLKALRHFAGSPNGTTWTCILARVERWAQALTAIGQTLDMDGHLNPDFLRDMDAMGIWDAVFRQSHDLRLAQAGPRADRFRPTIDEDDTAVVVADVTALKRMSEGTVKLTLELVYHEDLQHLTLGRAWLRCNASEDIPL